MLTGSDSQTETGDDNPELYFVGTAMTGGTRISARVALVSPKRGLFEIDLTSSPEISSGDIAKKLGLEGARW